MQIVPCSLLPERGKELSALFSTAFKSMLRQNILRSMDLLRNHFIYVSVLMLTAMISLR